MQMEDNKTALQTWLKGRANDDATSRRTATLHWLNGNINLALSHFETFKKLKPNYTIKDLNESHAVWRGNIKIQSIEIKAFKELAEAYNNSKK